MKRFALLLLLLSTCAFADAGFLLRCKAEHNSEVVLDTQVHLVHMRRNLSIGGDHQFEFILSRDGGNEVELQAFDSSVPSRSYASAPLDEAGANVQLSIWKREFLMEVRCTRL